MALHLSTLKSRLLTQNLTAAVQLVDSVQSSTVDTLYKLFDRNKNGVVELSEVSWGLCKLKPQLPLEAARQEALDLFLLFDHEEDRCHTPLRLIGFTCAHHFSGTMLRHSTDPLMHAEHHT